MQAVQDSRIRAPPRRRETDPVLRLLELSKICVEDGSTLVCSYGAGLLEIEVIGIGTAHAAVIVDGSDDHGGYGVGIFMHDGCIRVAPGMEMRAEDPTWRIDDAFISTWTGGVYSSHMKCELEGGNARSAAQASGLE